jgi:drug/metabolite transporter (DMT)-like permease
LGFGHAAFPDKTERARRTHRRRPSLDRVLAIAGGLGAACCWATTTLVASRAGRLVDPLSLLASVMTVGLLIAAPAAAVSGVPDGLDGRTAEWMALSGLCNIAGLLCSYAALRAGKVGVVAPITSTEGAVAAVIAVVAGEALSPGAGVALGVIVLGVALAARSPQTAPDERRSQLRAPVLAGAAALSFGLGLYATGHVGQEVGVAWAVLPPRVVGVVGVALPLLALGRWRLPRAAVALAVLGGAAEVLGFALYAYAAREDVAVAAVLASQFAGIAAVVGYLAFRERIAPVQVVGVVTIVAGVSVLSALTA